MKRMHSQEGLEKAINESELAEQVNELAAVYTYEDLTLTEAQYTELTSTGSVQIDLSEDPDSLARLHNANVVTIYTNPEHTGKVIIAQRQTLTASKATFTAFENDDSTINQYAMDVNLVVEGEGGAVNIGLAEVGGGTKLYTHYYTFSSLLTATYFSEIGATESSVSLTAIKIWYITNEEAAIWTTPSATVIAAKVTIEVGSGPKATATAPCVVIYAGNVGSMEAIIVLPSAVVSASHRLEAGIYRLEKRFSDTTGSETVTAL